MHQYLATVLNPTCPGYRSLAFFLKLHLQPIETCCLGVFAQHHSIFSGSLFSRGHNSREFFSPKNSVWKPTLCTIYLLIVCFIIFFFFLLFFGERGRGGGGGWVRAGTGVGGGWVMCCQVFSLQLLLFGQRQNLDIFTSNIFNTFMPFKAERIQMLMLDHLGTFKFHHCIGIALFFLFFFVAYANSTLLTCMIVTCSSTRADTMVNLERCAAYKLFSLHSLRVKGNA